MAEIKWYVKIHKLQVSLIKKNSIEKIYQNNIISYLLHQFHPLIWPSPPRVASPAAVLFNMIFFELVKQLNF